LITGAFNTAIQAPNKSKTKDNCPEAHTLLKQQK